MAGTYKAPHLDAGLGDGDGLLLHGLVDGNLVFDVHLVKLIDAADAIVRQHQRASLYTEVVCVALLRMCREVIMHKQTSSRFVLPWADSPL